MAFCRNAHIYSLYQLIILTAVSLLHSSPLVSTSKAVSATVPVNPVETDGILSLSCRVRNFDVHSHTLHIYRRTIAAGQTEQLSVDGAILEKVDDRMFLAFRQLEGQSAIYFLSIMDVTKEDQGLYSCKIITKDGRIMEIASDEVNISVTYFPADTDPVCSHLSPGPIMEGTKVTLNCSSEVANPQVSINWQTTTGTKYDNTKRNVVNNRIYSVLTIKASRKDNGVVFLCEITSDAFPDTSRSCHIGPLSVLTNPDLSYDVTEHVPETPVLKPTKSSSTKIVKTDPNFSAKNCNEMCSYFSYPLLHWIVATAAAVFLAIVFLICIVFIYGKYRHIKRQTKEQFHGVPRLPEGIYSELECKHGEAKMYMTLVDSATPGNQVELHDKKTGGYYGAMPVNAQQF
ncbi:uncharacterized protein [Amphiura filiformis]|uniref:uncharacterized protein n=1 Tax=Amphiura filiformis TaxID=82378 RepID=UPI003B20C37C